jgi:serine protease Do
MTFVRKAGAASLLVGQAVLFGLWPEAVRGRERMATPPVRGGARLGVVLTEVGAKDLPSREGRGALVREVKRESPAKRAGLQEGDIIVGYQGEAIRSASHLIRLLGETPAGHKVTLDVIRNGSRRKLSATLDAGEDEDLVDQPAIPQALLPPVPMPFQEGEPVDPASRDRLREFRSLQLGISYMEITDELARGFERGGTRGILVTHVDEAGPAGRADLRAGDVITSVDGRAISGPGDFRRAVVKRETALTLTVRREGKTMDLNLKLD